MSEPRRPPRQTDTSGHAARSLVTEWKWPLTISFLVCLVIAAVLYALDRPLAGFVAQVQGVLTGGALLGIALGLVRLFTSIRQMAGAERNSGRAASRSGATEAKLDQLIADLAPLFVLLAQGAPAAPPQRGSGRRREDTGAHDVPRPE